MRWIDQIAFNQGRRDEVPNQQLAKDLAETKNKEGLNEISKYLWDKNPSIASDCLKVLYETGYINPGLVADYVDDYIKLLTSKNNRMVWGSMIALSTVAGLKADIIWENLDLIINVIRNGTLITEVSGIKVLTKAALANQKYKEKIINVLFEFLENCRPVDFASRVETISPLITSSEEKEIFAKIIELKKTELSEAQNKKLKTVWNKFLKMNQLSLVLI